VTSHYAIQHVASDHSVPVTGPGRIPQRCDRSLSMTVREPQAEASDSRPLPVSLLVRVPPSGPRTCQTCLRVSTAPSVRRCSSVRVSSSHPQLNYVANGGSASGGRCDQGTQTPDNISRETRNCRLRSLKLHLSMGPSTLNLR
jgi:hypothetical protein